MAKYAKFWIAITVAALNGVVAVLPVGSAATQWINFALTVLGALAVLGVPNASAKRPAAPAGEHYPQPGQM